MKKNNVLLYFLFFILYCYKAFSFSDPTLSDQAYVSVLSCGKSEALYGTFGHSAIRIKDPANAIDLCFNYGTFNFDDPNFYTKFLHGKLNYYLSVNNFNDFKISYIEENRSVSEQKLALTPAEVNLIYKNLLENYKLENRYYQYEFVEDNCATKILEILERSIPKEKLSLKKHEYTLNKKTTIRKLIDSYTGHNDFLFVGINLLFGYNADTPFTYRKAVFLPDFLKQTITYLPIYQDEKVLVLGDEHPFEKKHYFKLFFWTLFLFLLISFIYDRMEKNVLFVHKIAFYIYHSFFLLFGIIGLILIYLWLFSEHEILKWNIDLFWSNPLVLLFLIIKRRTLLKTIIKTCILLFMLLMAYFDLQYLLTILPVLFTLILGLSQKTTNISL
ncbi:DUF4105 domain-containing protein [Aquimarina sp. RZ0]|uniref:lipoprotein N-acyltransferase Lnb domain-containing protein n=1 Tax=Aquimarina sp. RZ0 TaxID=2607730 RepID=UPI0011F1A54D|nr:DUF4105 domain-containing protein [Aquimarina sp. RZ0]KAA1243609.1 DUF4105 domain-containing protein [Aquimarina sp. RZ0]